MKSIFSVWIVPIFISLIIARTGSSILMETLPNNGAWILALLVWVVWYFVNRLYIKVEWVSLPAIPYVEEVRKNVLDGDILKDEGK